MTNIVALCLIVGTFLAAEVWTPSPAMTDRTEERENDVIVKDGYRVVVVEYDREGRTNTKISISPPETKHGKEEEEGEAEERNKSLFGKVKEKAKETASHIPNIAQRVPHPEAGHEMGGEEEVGEASAHHATPGELICDAFGKCRHKIASALGRAKDQVSQSAEEARGVGETASDTMGEVSEAAARKIQAAKETVGRMAHEKTHNMAQQVKETATQKTHDFAHKAHNLNERAKETLSEKAQYVTDAATKMAQEEEEKAVSKAQTAWGRIKTVAWEVLSPAKVGSVVGLMGVSAAYGTCVWVTFVSSYVLSGALGRHQFGLVQSKVYPVYFKAISLGILVGLLGHVLGRPRRLLRHSTDMWQALNLLASLIIEEGNAIIFEPRATKAMFERMKVEKEEGRGRETAVVDDGTAVKDKAGEREEVKQRLRELSERLQRLNTYSSWLNILTLMSLTWHLVYLGQRLSVAC